MGNKNTTRVSLDFDTKQLELLDLVRDHMGIMMGGKVSTAQAVRALIAGYVRKNKLEKEGADGGKDNTQPGS